MREEKSEEEAVEEAEKVRQAQDSQEKMFGSSIFAS